MFYFNQEAMEYSKRERMMPVCLECGDKIKYGRTDKKFCCEDCKNKHYNKLAKAGRAYRRKIMSRLTRNYQILEQLIKDGIESVDLTDIVSAGFAPEIVTGYHKNRCRSDQYWCFDIKYSMSDSRVYSISKIRIVSLNLHPDME